MNRKEGRGDSTIIIIHQFSPSHMRQFLNPVLRTPDSMPKIYTRKGNKRRLYNVQDIINSKDITYQRECCDRVYTQNHRSTTEVGVIRRSQIDLKNISRPKMQSCSKANCSCSQSVNCGYERGKGTSMEKKKLKLPPLKEFGDIEIAQPSSKPQKSRNKKQSGNMIGQRSNTSNHQTERSISKASKGSKDQQIQTQFNHFTPTNRVKAGKESTPATESIKTQTKVNRMKSQSNSESKQAAQLSNLRQSLQQSLKQPNKIVEEAGPNHVQSKRKQSDDTHSISSFTLKNEASNTVFQQIKKMIPKTQTRNRPKSRAYSILSNGLFKIPEEEEYEDYLAYYKPMSSSFNIKDLIKQQNFHIVPTANHVYFGQIVDRKKNGKGITVSEKEIYEGNYKDNVKISGCEKNRDGRYFGEFVNGKRSGQGRFQWNNGEVFEGEWKEGKKNGFGVWKSPRGDFYEGEWKNNRQNGKGYYVHKGGSKYRGTFKEFLKHGQGEEEFENGDKYIGQYQFGKPHGFGKYIWANGDTYQGDFVQGSREGKGKLKRVTGQIYEGGFKLDLKHGPGKQKYKSGQSFEGEFKDGQRYKGKLRTKNGAEILITPN